MNSPDYLDLLAAHVVRCTAVNNRAERIVVERGVIEAMGHILDPGANTDERAMRQGWDYLCLEVGALPRRMRNLFVAGFMGIVASYRAQERARQEGVR
ncbi:hypothetical protein [Paraburkholderia sediminicola]|uniref:hypothetical protein n=1 Tax=Paraburkholderia sediminicola TaxID=458836 RepID=UPI0038BAE447